MSRTATRRVSTSSIRPDWDYKFSRPLLDYYVDSRGMAFEALATADEALEALARHADGYVVWDTSVRTSLIVAFTAAGLAESIVVTEDLIPLAESHGLAMKADFRGRFTGLSDADIYAWAYERISTDAARTCWSTWEAPPVDDETGVADFGMREKAFFTDASTDPADAAEYAVRAAGARRLEPLAVVLGWHSYAKDTEAQHVTLASPYALRVSGLHSWPNLSFHGRFRCRRATGSGTTTTWSRTGSDMPGEESLHGLHPVRLSRPGSLDRTGARRDPLRLGSAR